MTNFYNPPEESINDDLQRSLLPQRPLPTVHAGARSDVRDMRAVVLQPVQLAVPGEVVLPRLRPAAPASCTAGGVG